MSRHNNISWSHMELTGFLFNSSNPLTIFSFELDEETPVVLLLMKTDSQRKQEKNFINLPWLILLNREAKNLDMNCSIALYYIKERISPTERETNKIIRPRLNFWVETFVHYIRHLFFFYDQFAVSCQKNNLWNKIKQVSNS